MKSKNLIILIVLADSNTSLNSQRTVCSVIFCIDLVFRMFYCTQSLNILCSMGIQIFICLGQILDTESER